MLACLRDHAYVFYAHVFLDPEAKGDQGGQQMQLQFLCSGVSSRTGPVHDAEGP